MVEGPLVAGGLHITITATWTECVTALASLILAGAGIKALSQLKEAKSDRHAHMIVELGNRWDSQIMLKARRKATRYEERLATMAAAYSDTPVGQDFLGLLRVPNYFEDLALLVKKGGLDPHLVSLGFKALIDDEWARWKTAITVMRKDDPFMYTQFEWLRDEMQKQPDA
ncbi:MAG TPA: hypothetical protein VGO31_00845 [Microbacteriaceae bacterium]|jgi:hypothetical protein|nr:hypothetical protein [Microbacteriaceae bacterium]